MTELYCDKKDRTKHIICAILGVCIACILTGSAAVRRVSLVQAKTQEVQEGLAKEVFRFHVLANSDSDEDQEVKLAVRDEIIRYMKESMDEEGEESSVDATKAWAQSHLGELTDVANKVLAKEGYDYRAHAEVTKCYFPEKCYGDITFPQGDYEALRIELGEAGGHNWWCVLYPNLCFMDTTCAVVSDEGKEELKDTLTEEEYEMVTSTTDFKIRWFFLGD